MRMILAIHLKFCQISSPHTVTMTKSFAFFLDSLKIGGDSVQTNDIDFEIKCGCVVQQNGAGEVLFCKAVKVDASLSDVELKKNVRNMISLLNVPFENLGEAMTW